jgi:uncharacterized protein
MLRLSRSISLVVAAGLLALAAYHWFGASSSLPLVDDGAELLSAAQRQRIAEHHAYLLADHDIDYRVVTARGLGDVNQAAVALFQRLADDGHSKGGRGLLLLIDADADLVRLEVGYALEGVFPDAFAAYIEQRQMVPFFERGRVADGILATTELIVTRAQHAAANAGYETEAWHAGSGGAGATASARLGAGAQPAPTATGAAARPGRSPAETLEAYFAAMAARNADPDLAIYTPESRRMLTGWVMTPAQMDNVAKSARSCPPGVTKIAPEGRHAVIRYPAAARGCPPYFLARAEGGWALDFVTMQRVIRFGRSNAWRLAERSGHPYAFAFHDWRFDRNGFPRVAE